MTKKIKSIVIVDGDRPSCQAEASPLSAAKPSFSIEIRAAQIKPAPWTTQLAPALLQFRRTVRTKPFRMPRPVLRLIPFHFGSIALNLFRSVQAHPRNIPPERHRGQVETRLLFQVTAPSLRHRSYSPKFFLLFTNLSYFHRHFCARMPLHWRAWFIWPWTPLLAFPQEVVDVSALFQLPGGLSSVLGR